ncbi:MAG: RluA family pseudouridine synthase [Anaeroplasmataceae bacterium]|nr:RluA family pseudouridine synthase [Anaeroplasmataceae bacterium]
MKENELIFKVEKEDILSEILKTKFSKRMYRYLKYSQAKVLVDGHPLEWYKRVSRDSIIQVFYETKEREIEWEFSQTIPDILYESEHYLVVNKEPNLLTIPTKANPNSLYQQLLAYLGNQSIHILNRLDKETSGLVVVAKDRYAASLLEPTHQHIIRKYLCLVEGVVFEDGIIQTYIDKEENSNKRYVSSAGKWAVSHYRVLKAFKDSTLLEFTLETGRTHQIRVHTRYIGHPIIGDHLYGGKDNEILCLTSYFVQFKDPFTNEDVQCGIKQRWKDYGRE